MATIDRRLLGVLLTGGLRACMPRGCIRTPYLQQTALAFSAVPLPLLSVEGEAGVQ